jgi:hypothetical protein
MAETIAECDFHFLLWEWQMVNVQAGFSSTTPRRTFSLRGIIRADVPHLWRRASVIHVYTGDWIENKRANRRHQSEDIEGEIGVLQTARPIAHDTRAPQNFDHGDPEFVAFLHLNSASCEAALSMCQDVLANGYHIVASLRAAGPGLKRLPCTYPRDPHFSTLTGGLPDHVEIRPDEIDFSKGFKVAVRGIEFARTTLPLKVQSLLIVARWSDELR